MPDEWTDITDRPAADPSLEWVLRYFDGDLSPAELAEFNMLLRGDAAVRRRFSEYCTQSCLLRETFSPETQALQRREPYLPARANARPKSRRWAAGLAAAAVLVAALGTAAWFFRGRSAQADVIGALEKFEGDVRVLSADGQPQASAANMRVRSGDTIRTHGAQSMAVLAYADGSRLALVGDANMTCTEAGHKGVVVHEGTLLASIARQPDGAPMLLTTTSAQVQVRGTRFVIEAQAEQTDVKVTDGQVSVIRSSDGKRFDVPAGKRVVASANSNAAVEDIKNAPDTWKVDFAQGLPKGWNGEFVTDNLPRGSRGAIKAVPAQRAGDSVFEIRSADMWFNGLFSVHEDSYLSVTFKMEKPGWVNFFIMARTAEQKEPESTNYLFNKLKFWPPQPGKWRSIRIPLSLFGRAGSTRPSTLKNEVPYLLLFSSVDEDRGLVIDRIEVGRGALADVEYSDVE